MSSPFRIEGELTVFAVHALKDRLMAALNESPDLRIDISDVTEVDGAGIQLLLAARREALQRGGSLQLGARPPHVVEALELTDLADEFGEPFAHDEEATA